MSVTPEAMPNAVEVPAAGRPLRLTMATAAAAKQVAACVAKGLAIRKHRLRDLADLDKARAEKKTWVAACVDVLTRAFDGPAVADACNDWAGRILPEYAPLGLFVEQFYEEMDHRLRRLQAVVDHLDDLATTEIPPPPGTAPAAAPAERRDEPKGKSLNWARLFPTAEEMAGAEAAVATPAKPAEAKPPTPAAVPSPLVKPVGLLLARSADDAKAVAEFLTDLAVAPRVATPAEGKSVEAGVAEMEALLGGPTPPAFALVWPHEPADAAAAARSQFQLGFLVGRLGQARVCLMRPPGHAADQPAAVPAITLDAGGGWQLPLARTLKRAGVAVDLNRLC